MFAPYSSLITAVIGLIVGGAVTWGAMRKTVSMLSTQVNELREIVSELTPLKTDYKHLADEFRIMRESMATVVQSVHSIEVDMARSAGWHTNKGDQ